MLPMMTPNAPDSRPLVLHVIPSLGIGGAERFVIELCDRLPWHGFRTKLLVLFGDGPLRTDVRMRNIRWSQVAPSIHTNRFTFVRHLERKIFTDIDRRPAIVHTHLFGADFWTLMARALHAPERLFSEQGVPYPRFLSTAHNIDHEDSVIRHAVRRFSVHGYERIVSVSDAVREYAIKNLGASPRRVMTIDGMSFLDAPPRPPVPFHDPPRFVTVARLVPQKGIETALRALANVPPPWQYTILGGGVLERDLKELAESLGIASRVRFMGASLRSPEILEESDVFLFPSRWEGLGSAVIEAASIGLPALVSDIPALRSVFPESSRLPVDDPEAWTKAIRALLRTPDRVQASAQALMPGIRSRFHPDTIVRQYAGVYRELLGGA